MSAQEFLNLYKELEEDLEHYFETRGRHSASPIYDYMNSKEGQPFKEKLDTCREIRNLLSHHADIDGESVVEPAYGLIDFLEELITYINNPPLAIDRATPAEGLLTTDETRNVYALMQIMDKRGFSHVPVVVHGRVIGVFSISTVFDWQLANPEGSLSMTSTIKDMSPFLPVSKHRTEQFVFANRDLTLSDARALLEKKQKGKHVAVIFITRGGDQNDELLGMITPWDVLGHE